MGRQAFGEMIRKDRQAWKQRIPAMGIQAN
jgi:hypothetical protein